MEKGRGLTFVFSAPSGTGKTTLLRRVVEELPGLRFSISYTTRSPRANEREGIDYYFVTHSVFQKMVERGEFLEWAEVLGNRYGTARVNFETLKSEGIDLVLDIDTQGAKKVSEEMDHAILIYILPPSLKILEERLVKRGLDSPEIIKLRLTHAKKDIGEAHWYHYVIVNERIEDTVEKMKAIIIAERCRRINDLIINEKKEGMGGEGWQG
jgi:guanylate kinase